MYLSAGSNVSKMKLNLAFDRHRRAASQRGSPMVKSRTLSRKLPEKMVQQAIGQSMPALEAGPADERVAHSLEDPQTAGSTGSPSSPFSKWLQLGQPQEPELLQIEARNQGAEQSPTACLCATLSMVSNRTLSSLWPPKFVTLYCSRASHVLLL